jgi:serine/threonine protein kinase
VSLKDTPVVGNYRVVSKIAAGGMANIYKATHLTQGGVAVLKIPYEQFQNDPKFIERFQREAELGKKLHNENIIRIYESGISKEGLTFIAMEYLEGIDLRQYLNKYGKVPIQEAVKTIVQVCRALDYAHTKGITHRDIKPENIMLPEPKGKGRVVLMDFGVAHQAYLVTVGTRSTYLGTPHYMSPDQLSDEGIDNRSDIYSLGVVLFEMLTGRRPFDETDPLKLILQHKETPPPIPSSLNSKISPELNTLILKMLAKKPEDRYQNVESILVELQEYSLKKGFMFD